MAEVYVEEVAFEAGDGWALVGDLYRGEAPQVAVLISAGTGFPRRFYRHVAAWLAARGAVVLTYDYRGIGDSGTENLAHSGIDYPDWGRHDMTAALEALEQVAPGLPLVTLGHSIGGQFVGFMGNHAKVARHAFVSVGSGYWGVHHRTRLPLELYFWWGFGTFSLWRWGEIRPVGGWGGAALPPEVFRTWRRWSQRRSYIKPDLAARRWPHHFDEVAAPICAWVFPDDGIATPTAARDTLSCYPKAEKHLVVRKAQELGVSAVGHEGAFRKGREALWEELWLWLTDGQLPEGGGVAVS
ncbi:alpha/beta fold hydrolase [Pelagimonas sp. KU-00592-HH]|uniref:alpha/beta hydrolase family protein n=1 Tax=Pelagimonas sp. KU-00592-HH TaxID=3127651 RepID=UPI003108B5E2